MSTQFVRYTPDIEATELNFDENLQIVIDRLEEYIAGSVTTEGTGRAVRDAHAKGYGVVKAEVELLGQLPADYAHGIYAAPGKHGALIRVSNGQPHAGPDMLLGSVDPIVVPTCPQQAGVPCCEPRLVVRALRLWTDWTIATGSGARW